MNLFINFREVIWFRDRKLFLIFIYAFSQVERILVIISNFWIKQSQYKIVELRFYIKVLTLDSVVRRTWEQKKQELILLFHDSFRLLGATHLISKFLTHSRRQQNMVFLTIGPYTRPSFFIIHSCPSILLDYPHPRLYDLVCSAIGEKR